MTWRNWMVGISLGIALGAGCTRAGVRAPNPAWPEPEAVALAPAAHAAPVNESPYHPLPQPSPRPGEKAPEAPTLPNPVPPPEPPPVLHAPADVFPVKVASPPRPPADPPLIEAVRSFLKSQPDFKQAIHYLREYDPPTQEMLLSLLALVGLLNDEGLTQLSPSELTHAADDLSSLVQQLRARTPLIIDKMVFCRQIERYGVYEPLPSNHQFRPGDVAQIYVELRNFTSEQQGDHYVTRLSNSFEVRDFQKKVSHVQHLPAGIDRSRTPRQDYFSTFRVPISLDTPPGKYTLWIKVKDDGKPGQPEARRSLDFQVGLPVRGGVPN